MLGNLGAPIFLVHHTQNWEPFPDSASVSLNCTERARVLAYSFLLTQAGVAHVPPFAVVASRAWQVGRLAQGSFLCE